MLAKYLIMKRISDILLPNISFSANWLNSKSNANSLSVGTCNMNCKSCNAMVPSACQDQDWIGKHSSNTSCACLVEPPKRGCSRRWHASVLPNIKPSKRYLLTHGVWIIHFISHTHFYIYFCINYKFLLLLLLLHSMSGSQWNGQHNMRWWEIAAVYRSKSNCSQFTHQWLSPSANIEFGACFISSSAHWFRLRWRVQYDKDVLSHQQTAAASTMPTTTTTDDGIWNPIQ